MQSPPCFFKDIAIIRSRFTQVYLGMQNKILMQNGVCGFYKVQGQCTVEEVYALICLALD